MTSRARPDGGLPPATSICCSNLDIVSDHGAAAVTKLILDRHASSAHMNTSQFPRRMLLSDPLPPALHPLLKVM
jgi:hypothetical protein